MRAKVALIATFATILVPASAFALEGIGPRVNIVGTVTSATFTDQQKADHVGGILKLTAKTNGQVITVNMDDFTQVTSEGQSSRKRIATTDIQENMQLRIRGTRQGTDSIYASLIVIENAQTNPVLTNYGTILSIDGGSITVQLSNNETRSILIGNETEVNVSYQLFGAGALSLIGKDVFITLNPQNKNQAKVLRIVAHAASNTIYSPR